MTMVSLIEKSDKNNDEEIRSVQVTRRIDQEEEKARLEGRDKKRPYAVTDTIKDLEKEVRNVRYANQLQGKKHNRHYYNISIPKSYCRIFKITNKDLFIWNILKTNPLTFELRLLNTDTTVNNTFNEEGDR